LASSGDSGLLLPGAREAAAHAEIEELERMLAARPGRQYPQHDNPLGQPGASGGPGCTLIEAPEVEFIDDVKHVNFKAHHMELRTACLDAKIGPVSFNSDELALETKVNHALNTKTTAGAHSRGLFDQMYDLPTRPKGF